jgi:hypothetical protein
MRHRSFGDFVDKKKRESIRQLGLIKQMLEQNNLKVDNFLESNEDSDPYIFCYSPLRGGAFDGVRIYKIGNELAFRIQKESKTHPYGAAYPLPVESMFNDYLTDNDSNEEKAGQKIIESIGKELQKFFEKSIKAERGSASSQSKDVGSVLVRTTGTDYSALIYNKA